MGCYNSTIQRGDDKINYPTIEPHELPSCFAGPRHGNICCEKCVKCRIDNCGFNMPHFINSTYEKNLSMKND